MDKVQATDSTRESRGRRRGGGGERGRARKVRRRTEASMMYLCASPFAASPSAATTAAAAALMESGSAFLCGQSLPIPARTRALHCRPVIEAKAVTRSGNRAARHQRIRKKVEGTPERPRMSVFRSNKHLYVQVIDDTKMHTLASASTVQKPVSDEFDYNSGPTIEVAKKVGEAIAKSCSEKGITKVAFDRGGYLYHGRIEALANAAREHGLQF